MVDVQLVLRMEMLDVVDDLKEIIGLVVKRQRHFRVEGVDGFFGAHQGLHFSALYIQLDEIHALYFAGLDHGVERAQWHHQVVVGCVAGAEPWGVGVKPNRRSIHIFMRETGGKDRDVVQRELRNVEVTHLQVVLHRIKGIHPTRGTNRVGKHQRRIAQARTAIDHVLALFRLDAHAIALKKVLSPRQAVQQAVFQAVDGVALALPLKIVVLECAKHAGRLQFGRLPDRNGGQLSPLVLGGVNARAHLVVQVTDQAVDQQIFVDSAGLVVFQMAVGLVDFFLVGKEPVQIKRVLAPLKFIGAIDAVKVKADGIEVVFYLVTHGNIKLHNDKVFELLLGFWCSLAHVVGCSGERKPMLGRIRVAPSFK